MDMVGEFSSSVGCRLSLSDIGQAEVEDLDLVVGRQNDVRWFQVAMNDSLAVCRFHPLGDLMRDVEGLGSRNPSALASRRARSSPSTSSSTK